MLGLEPSPSEAGGAGERANVLDITTGAVSLTFVRVDSVAMIDTIGAGKATVDAVASKAAPRSLFKQIFKEK